MRPRPTRRPSAWIPLLLLGACHAPAPVPDPSAPRPAAEPPAPTHRTLPSGRVVPVFPATLHPPGEGSLLAPCAGPTPVPRARALGSPVPARPAALARARNAPGVRTYAVADLVRGVPSYPGRELGLAPPWGWEDAPAELGPPVVEADALVDWIRATVWPGTWDEDGHSIQLVGDLLVVRHSNLR